MSKYHERPRRPARVSEAAPVQVFLDRDDRARLDRLTAQLDASKSNVLRQSLAALERQLLDPLTHPALRIIGLVEQDDGLVDGGDVGVHHDRYLADAHDESPPPAPAPKPAARSRRRRGKS